MRERESVILTVGIVVILCILIAFLFTNLPASPGKSGPVSCQTSSGGPITEGLIFREDFDSGLSRWELQGYPLPATDPTRGTPAPSFDNRGDDMYDNMAVSRENFTYTDGLIIAFDMFLNDSLPEGCWVDGLVRIPRTSGGSGAAVQVTHRVIGEACYDNPSGERFHGVWDFGITNQSGGYEWFTEIGGSADEDLGEWHHYAIVIRPDHYVDFYVDGSLRYHSREPMNQSFQGMPLAIGSRSHPDFGPALIDSIRVYHYSDSFDPANVSGNR